MKKQEPTNRSSDSTTGKTREFADSTNPPVRSKKLFASGLRRFLKRYRTLLIVLITGALVVTAIYSVVSERGASSNESASTDKPFSDSDLLNQNEFLDAFLLNNLGGLEAEKLQSIRVVGQIVDGEASREFTAVKKRPNLAYLRLYLDQGVNLTYGMNGGRIWRRINAPGSSAKEEWATEDEARELQSMTNFFSPLISVALQQRELVKSIENSDELGRPTIAVQFRNEQTGDKSVAHLDPVDLSPLVRFDHLADGRIRRSDFSEFRMIEGFRFPCSIVTQIEDAEQKAIKIDRIALNPGVLSEFFEPPSSLE
ncbi:MAG: hypothetical protein GVY36_11275 [Verrucomicrobia bacterium]|jgi:hypothetical protein|nr:hypothetical protein [Verrucomicrobiota bacterium]